MKLPRLVARLSRFSLRAALLAMIVLAILLGWKVNRTRAQRRAADELREYGRIVWREPWGPVWLHRAIGKEFFQDVNAVLLEDRVFQIGPSRLVSNDTLGRLVDLPTLERAAVLSSHVTNEGLAAVGAAGSLKFLAISGGLDDSKPANIDDAGIARLSSLRNLTELHINSQQVGVAGVQVIAGLPTLERLRLDNVPVTDQTLAAVARCKSLRFLQMTLEFQIHAEVTDAGLAQLETLKTLEELTLDLIEGVSQVTPEGQARLEAALPGAKISLRWLR